MCGSIGHRPLGAAALLPSSTTIVTYFKQGTGIADHLTLLRLLLFSSFDFGAFSRIPFQIGGGEEISLMLNPCRCFVHVCFVTLVQ